MDGISLDSTRREAEGTFCVQHVTTELKSDSVIIAWF
jgi:hypothetical protein